MSDLIKFLLGESEFDGFWFGEHPPRKTFFWRKHLHQEWARQQQRIIELTAAVERLRDFADKVENWNECTADFRVNFGANGERDYYRNLAREVLAAAPQQSLAEHDAEVARVAYKQGFNDVWNEDFFDEFYEHNELAEDCANQYANKIKAGDL